MKSFIPLAVFLLPGIYITFPGNCFSQASIKDEAAMQHDIDSIQVPMGRQQQQSAASRKGEMELPAPDLLKEAITRPPLRLSDLEALALRNSPTLRQANGVIRRSAGQATQAGLYPNPSVGYEGEQIRGGSYGGGEQGAFVQQTIVLGGKLGLRRHVYQKQQQEDELGAKEQQERVLGEVDQCFYTALAAQETVKIRKEFLSLATDAAQTAHQLANVGQADAPDVLQAEVESEQAQIEYITAQRTFIQDFHRLMAISGNPQLKLSSLAGTLEQRPSVDGNRVIDAILNGSPAVERAQQAITVAEAKLKSAKREAVPDITLRAGLRNNYEPIGPLGRPVGLQGFGTGTITLPIFNRNQGNVQAAKAELQNAQSEVIRVRLSLRQTAEPILQSYLADEEQVERYKNEILPRAAHAYQLYLEKYRAMAAAYPQVLISQRTLLQLRISYVLALRNLWTNALALQHFTLSGGLESINGPEAPAINGNLPNAGESAP